MNMFTRWCLWDMPLLHLKEEIRRPLEHGRELPTIHNYEIVHRAAHFLSSDVRDVCDR